MKRLMLLITTFILSISLVACKREDAPINYQDSISIPSLIEIDMEDVPNNFDDFVEIKDYDAVMKVSFNMDNVYFDVAGDYSIKITVDYSDGVTKTFNCVLRLSLHENIGLPRIIGVRNRIFSVGTTGVDLLSGIAFTDTSLVMDSGMTGEVSFDTEGIYHIEYYVEDNDGNMVYESAYIIIGEIPETYDDFTKTLYRITADEKAVLNDYSLLYTMALENNYVDAQNILDHVGFFITPELFERLLQRELRLDEYNAIIRAQIVFKRNMTRLLREEYDWWLSEIERQYLDDGFKLLSTYINQTDFTENEAYEIDYSLLDLYLSSDQIFDDYDLEVISFMEEINSMYFDEYMLVVEAETDFEFSNESLLSSSSLFDSSIKNRSFEERYLLSVFNDTEKKNYFDYYVEYELMNFIRKEEYLETDIRDLVTMHDIVKRYIPLLYQDDIFLAYLYLDQAQIEEYLDRELTNEEIETLNVYLHFYNQKTENVLTTFINRYKEEYAPSTLFDIIEAYKSLQKSGSLMTSFNDKYRLTYEDPDVIIPYLHIIQYMLDTRTEFTGYVDALYGLEYYTSYLTNYIDRDNEVHLYHFNLPLNVRQRIEKFNHHTAAINLMESIFGAYIGESEKELIHQTIYDLVDRNISFNDMMLFIYTNELSVIREYYEDYSEIELELHFREYQDCIRNFVIENVEEVSARYAPLCTDECKEYITFLADSINYAPIMISDELYDVNKQDRRFVFTNVYNEDEDANYYLQSYLNEALQINQFMNEVMDTRMNAETLNYFSYNQLYTDEYLSHMKHYYELYQTEYFGASFASPGKLLFYHQIGSPNFTELNEEQFTSLTYLYNYQKRRAFTNELEDVFNLSLQYPEFIEPVVIRKITNYYKLIPSYITFIDDSHEAIMKEYGPSLDKMDAYEAYAENEEFIRKIYDEAIERELSNKVTCSEDVLLDEGYNLINFRFDVYAMYRSNLQYNNWIDELNAFDLDCLENYATFIFAIDAVDDYPFTTMFQTQFNSTLINDVQDFYIDIIKADGHPDDSIEELQDKLTRPLTKEESYLLDWMNQCDHTTFCDFVNEITIMYNAGFLNESFTIDDIIESYELLSTLTYDDVKEDIQKDTNLTSLIRFNEVVLKQDPLINDEYIARYVSNILQEDIDLYYSSINDDTDLLSQTEDIYNLITTVYDEVFSFHRYTINFYTTEEDLHEYLVSLNAIIQTENMINTIELSYYYTYTDRLRDIIDLDHSIDLLNNQELSIFIRDYTKYVLSEFEYQYPENLISETTWSDILIIHKMDVTSEDYDETIHEINVDTAKFFVKGYLDREHIPYDETLLHYYSEVTASYIEHFTYAADNLSLQEIMSFIGYEFTPEEIVILEEILLMIPIYGFTY